MTNNNVLEGLYGQWFNAVPNFLAALSAPASRPDTAAVNGSVQPSPIGQMEQALEFAQRLMKPLYESMLQALALDSKSQSFDGFVQLLQGRLGDLNDRLATLNLASLVQPGLARPLAAGGANAPFAMLAEALKPLSLNLERTHGGLVEIFGLGSTREFQQALRDMAAASVEQSQAQAEYLGLAVAALAKGNTALMNQLVEMRQRGESVDSVKALVRLWARAVDEALHTAMRSPSALDASARLVRTATRSRAQQQRMVALASQALNVPTRAEVDEAYREIQELKRELRRLRKPQATVAETLPSARKLPTRNAAAASKTAAKARKVPST